VDGEEAQKSLAAKARESVQKQLELLDQQLHGRPFVLGDRFSIADAYTPVFYHWCKKLGLSAGDAHRASVKTIIARPAVQRALAGEDVRLEV
jgi:glutathione S-transferase